jgi:hypothetical protein
MKKTVGNGPLSFSEIQRRVRDPKTKVVMAPQDAIEGLKLYVDRVLATVKDAAGIKCDAWISDESCLSDFFDCFRDRSKDQSLYDQIGQKLGIPLDRSNDDDHYIVKVALKLKRRADAPS